jgi:hypothetical protein
VASLIGQRWLYRIGNATVVVDNAFNWLGWGQERLRVNDETIHESQGWFRLSQTFSEPWLTRLGEGELKVRIIGQINSVRCEALLDGVAQDAESLMAVRWTGTRGAWPPETDWKISESGDFIARAGR